MEILVRCCIATGKSGTSSGNQMSKIRYNPGFICTHRLYLITRDCVIKALKNTVTIKLKLSIHVIHSVCLPACVYFVILCQVETIMKCADRTNYARQFWCSDQQRASHKSSPAPLLPPYLGAIDTDVHCVVNFLNVELFVSSCLTRAMQWHVSSLWLFTCYAEISM